MIFNYNKKGNLLFVNCNCILPRYINKMHFKYIQIPTIRVLKLMFISFLFDYYIKLNIIEHILILKTYVGI